jgi:hypothetical protein
MTASRIGRTLALGIHATSCWKNLYLALTDELFSPKTVLYKDQIKRWLFPW